MAISRSKIGASRGKPITQPAAQPIETPQIPENDGNEQIQKDLIGDAANKTRFQEYVVGTGRSQSTEAIRNHGAQKPSETQHANEMLGAGRIPANELQEKLVDLAALGFPEKAQVEFSSYVDKFAKDPEEKAKVVEALRQVVEVEPHVDVSTIEKSLANAGFQLRSSGRPVSGYQLDRAAFRNTLRDIVADAPKDEKGAAIIDLRAANNLIEPLASVVFVPDQFSAHWRISRELLQGKIRFTPEAESLVQRFFQNRFHLSSPNLLTAKERSHAVVKTEFATTKEGRADPSGIGYEIFMARKAGFSHDASDRLLNMILSLKKDPDALFFARRVFDRQMTKALRAATDPQEIKRLQQVAADFHLTLDPKLSAEFDRYSVKQGLYVMAAEGKIDAATHMAMMAAAVTSHSKEDFYRGIRRAQMTLAIATILAAMNQYWAEESKRAEEKRKEEGKDAERETYRIAKERLKEEQKTIELRKERETSEEEKEIIAFDNFLLSCQAVAAYELNRARTPEEAVQLENEIASIQNERHTLQLNPVPKSGKLS